MTSTKRPSESSLEHLLKTDTQRIQTNHVDGKSTPVTKQKLMAGTHSSI